jgi:hypothetical protein
MTDSARRFLLERHYPDHVVEGGLERLLRHWEDVAESVAQGEVQYQDDYLNDMDGRAILEELLPHLEASERAEAQRRLARADARLRTQLIPTSGCIWGEENARKHGYSRERDWWYYHRPRVVDDTWRDR